jgi:hypothetical protein
MSTHQILMRVEVEGNPLRYETEPPDPLVFEPGDVVVIGFGLVPPSCTPALAVPGKAVFGPFLSVQADRSSLRCEGYQADGERRFECWPLLLQAVPGSEEVRTLRPIRPFVVEVRQAAQRTVRKIHLHVRRDDSVWMVPETPVQIYDDSVVEWIFRFEDRRHAERIPVITFQGYEGSPGPQMLKGVGPFTALRCNVKPAAKDAKRPKRKRFRIIGSGNNGHAGQYSYSIGVLDPAVSENGLPRLQRLKTVDRCGGIIDPIIDNTGSPP